MGFRARAEQGGVHADGGLQRGGAVDQRGGDRVRSFRPAVGVEHRHQLPGPAPLDFLPAGHGRDGVGLAPAGGQEFLLAAAAELGFGGVGFQQQGGELLELARPPRAAGRGPPSRSAPRRPAGPRGSPPGNRAPAGERRRGPASQLLVGRHDHRAHRRRDPVRELPGADVHRHAFAEQEVHPDPVRVRLVGAVGEQQAVEILQREAAAQFQRDLLHELFHVLLLHAATLLPIVPGRECGGERHPTDSRRHLTLRRLDKCPVRYLEKPGIPRKPAAAARPCLSPASQPDLFWKYDFPHTPRPTRPPAHGAHK